MDTKKPKGSILVGEKDDFKIYFTASTQQYTVFKGELLMATGYRFSQVKIWIT